MTALKSIKWDGKQISKPGMYSNIPIMSYHRHDICDGPSISSSGLRKIFSESPAHFYSTWSGNPKRIESEDAAHFRIGRAIHHLVLGEKFFKSLFAVQPDEWPDDNGVLKPWHNSRNVCKAWNESRRKEGRTPLTRSDVLVIHNMALSLSNNPLVKAGALNGLIERSIFWKDKETGIWLKVRPDSIPGDSGDFVDLKTIYSVQWRDMVKSIAERGYHAQGALIREGAIRVLKMNNPTFSLVFAEKKAPYCTRVVTLKDNDLDLGDEQNRVALRRFADCLKSGRWPGPGGDRDDAAHIELNERQRELIKERINFMD